MRAAMRATTSPGCAIERILPLMVLGSIGVLVNWVGLDTYRLQEGDGVFCRQGNASKHFENSQIISDIIGLLQRDDLAQSYALDMYHIRGGRPLHIEAVRFELQDRKSACHPPVRAGLEGDDLEAEQRGRGQLDQMIELAAHGYPGTDHPA